MTDLVEAIRAKSDKMRVSIFTRSFRFDGYLHTPKVGKESRRLSDTLNADKNFLTVTQAVVTNLATGTKDAAPHQMLQVNMTSIEFIKPYFDD